MLVQLTEQANSSLSNRWSRMRCRQLRVVDGLLQGHTCSTKIVDGILEVVAGLFQNVDGLGCSRVFDDLIANEFWRDELRQVQEHGFDEVH